MYEYVYVCVCVKEKQMHLSEYAEHFNNNFCFVQKHIT